MSVTEQYYDLLAEASHANRTTAADLAVAKGAHPTYIYNTVRNKANLTFRSAEQLAEAAGYRMTISFEPLDGTKATLTGTMKGGNLYTERRVKPARAASSAAPAAGAPVSAQTTAADLDAELAELGDL